MNRNPRYTASEEMRDVLDALAEKLGARIVVVQPYTAVGTTTARISLSADKLPLAVALVGARLYFDLSSPITVTPTLNFVWDAGSKTAQVYEPSGLVSNTVYQLTYLVIGG